jgi:hypothetical protein
MHRVLAKVPRTVPTPLVFYYCSYCSCTARWPSVFQRLSSDGSLPTALHAPRAGLAAQFQPALLLQQQPPAPAAPDGGGGGGFGAGGQRSDSDDDASGKSNGQNGKSGDGAGGDGGEAKAKAKAKAGAVKTHAWTHMCHLPR